MIVFAILGTLAAVGYTLFCLFANSMRSSPGAFEGAATITAAWAGVAVLWLAWWVG